MYAYARALRNKVNVNMDIEALQIRDHKWMNLKGGININLSNV